MADSALRLSVLGAPTVELDGVPLAVDTRKAIALLVYLAVEPGSHGRDTLAALLWPEVDNERARAALRRTLSTLRAALGGAWVETNRDTVVLDRAGVWLDLDEFHRLADADGLDALERAAALHRGPFLAGFGLRDSPVFDDWQAFQAGTRTRELAAILDRASELRAGRGDWPRAIEHAQRRLALDLLHESSHRRLIELYAASGERSRAVEQYRVCVRILNRELGVAPIAATTDLYHAVIEGADAPVSPVLADPVPAGGRPDYPLVGRAPEWQALAEQLRRAAPDGRVVSLEGEAGIGKSRLAADFAAHARAQGRAVNWVSCFEHEAGLAYGSAIELVRGALRSGDAALDPAAASEAARLLPELGSPPAGSLDDPGAQARFFAGLTGVLSSALAGDRPALIVVDDVHWADSASLEVLGYLTRRLEGRPLLVVLCWRPEETPPEHPLRRLVAETAAARSGRALSLARLGIAEVAELVDAAGAPASLVAPLHAETEGLPFFVVEYLHAHDDARPELPLPAGVRELLNARLAAASELATQVLAAAAVIGRGFSISTVREVSGRSDEETVAALEELVRRGIITEDEHGTHGFRHEQLRKVAYESTSFGRRRLLHQRAADLLAGQATAGGGALAGAVAAHLRLGGREAEAASWYRAAGGRARGLYANAEALAHFQAALALGDPDQAGLLAEIGDLHTLAGDYAQALASYESAAALGPPDALAPLEHRIGLVHHRRGEWELADRSFDAALTSLEAGPLRARLLADRSLSAHRRGRDDEAQLLAEQALAAGADDGPALAQAHNILGILATGRREEAEARGHLERSLVLAAAAADPSAEAAALNNLALLDRREGELERALERTSEALARCGAVGDRHREAALINNLADLLHATGRHDEALEHLKSAVAIFAAIGGEGAMEPEIWKLVEW